MKPVHSPPPNTIASVSSIAPSAAASTCSSPDSSYAAGWQHYKMSIAFLVGSINEPRDTDMRDSSKEPAPTFRLPSYNSPEYRPRTPVFLPSLRLVQSPYPRKRTTLPRIGSSSSIHSVSSNQSHASSAAASYNSNNTSFSSINSTSPIKRHDSFWDAESAIGHSASSFHPNASFASINQPYPPTSHHHQHQQSHTPTHHPYHHAVAAEPLARIPRPARPSYSEEQKFFIMYYRIVKDLSWPEIKDSFARFFNLRTEDGLTSVYYRIRKSWGMEEVLKTGPGGSMGDRSKVYEKAGMFSREFLVNLGYFEP